MIKGHLIIGLDIGSANCKALAVAKNPDGLEIVGQAVVENSGVRKGVVISASQVSQKIKEALADCLNGIKSKGKVGTLAANINGSHLSFIPSRGLAQVSRADQKISEADVERVLQASRTISISANQEVLDVYPQEFIIDGQPGVREILGLRGIRLEAKTLCLAVFSPYLKNLSEAILAADLETETILPSVLASGSAVLTEKEKELGCVLLDLGAGTTGLAVFEEGILQHAAVLPLGSNNITNDIAVVLRIEVEEAERKKRDLASKTALKILAKVVEARNREIFSEVAKELKKINKPKLPGGVILTGGGAKLFGLVDFAKKELKLPARIGQPMGLTTEIEDPALAAAAGLVLEAAKNLETVEAGPLSRLKNIFKPFVP
jgi:cell division protein FtsA